MQQKMLKLFILATLTLGVALKGSLSEQTSGQSEDSERDHKRDSGERYVRTSSLMHGCQDDFLNLDVLDTTDIIFQTPNFPDLEERYQGPVSCTWILRAVDERRRVAIRVTDSKLDEQPGDWNCSLASGAVYDGVSRRAPLLGKFCGSDPVFYVSSGRHLTVTFATEGSSKGGNLGFAFQYFLYQPLQFGFLDPSVLVYSCKSFARVSATKQALIVSPGYPEKPLTSGAHTCYYVIEAEAHITLEGDVFDLEHDCSRNHLDVYNISHLPSRQARPSVPGYAEANFLERFCGKELSHLARRFKARRLLLVCSTLDVGAAKGFALRAFTQPDLACTGSSCTEHSTLKQVKLTGRFIFTGLFFIYAVMGFVVFILIVVLSVYCWKKRCCRSAREIPHNSSSSTTDSSTVTIQSEPNIPPPDYESAVALPVHSDGRTNSLPTLGGREMTARDVRLPVVSLERWPVGPPPPSYLEACSSQV